MEQPIPNPTIQEIRRWCRRAMNGDASAGMRKYGLHYKLNFGLMISQIRNIACRYTPDAELAESLWREDTRELKILAGMLYPTSLFDKACADRWAIEISNQEIREQLVLNLFCHLPFAENLTQEWSSLPDESIRTTAYWLLARLLMNRTITKADLKNSYQRLWSDALSEAPLLRQSAVLALKHIGRNQPEEAPRLIERIRQLTESSPSMRHEVAEELNFEFEFFAERNQEH